MTDTKHAWIGLAIASILAVLVPLVALNALREGGVGPGIERTASSVVGVSTGVIVAGVAISVELLGTVIGLMTAAPELVSTVALGIVGYLSIDGIVSVTPETWGILVILAFVVTIYARDARGA